MNVRPGAGEASATGANAGGLVPYGAKADGRLGLKVAAAIAVCALGGAAASSEAFVLAPALVAFGFVAARRAGARQAVLAAAAGIVSALLIAWPLGAFGVAAAALVVIAALCLAFAFGSGRMTSSASCVSVAVLAAALLAEEALFASLAGTSLQAAVESVFDGLAEQAGALTPSVAEQLEAVRAAVATLWPTTYVFVALAEFLAARFGTWLASSRGDSGEKASPNPAGFDAPLWVVGLLAAAGLGVAVSLTWQGSPQMVFTVSANLALSLRFAFAAQGFAVLAWAARTRKWGALASVLLAAVALYLEVRFFVLTIAGLVDVWADFRRLRGGGEEPEADAGRAEQDQ